MRQPINVIVFPYMFENDKPVYGIFRRSDFPIWQAISGGVEDDETPLETAIRECYEEAGIEAHEFIALDSEASIPADIFKQSHWENVYVVREKSFGVKVDSKTFKLSHEHTVYAWLSFDEAYESLRYDSNKVALWELNKRLLESKL